MTMTAITDRVRRSLRERTPGMGLTREFYTDDDVFALDLEHIFYRDWLFVAHSAELPGAGSYLTLQIGAYPIVLTRAADGVIRAFINSCRHRGARVCPEAAGTAAKLVCPYHQWTYHLDGRLFAARQMGPGLDRSQLGLRPVHCETVAGYIFICVATEAPDFGPTRRHLEPYLLPHRLTEARVAFQGTIIEEGNWKLVWENNRECYHCASNHPELARTFPDTPTVTSVNGAADDPHIVEHWRRCESAALASEFKLSPDGQMRTARMPLVDPAVSYTMTGQPAVRRRLSDSIPPDLNIGALLLFHYPTTWNHFLGDHAISFRVLPLGPTRTELTTKWLVHRDAVEGVDYDVAELTRVWLATNEQDRRIVRENQIGMNCPTYEPGPLSNVTEGGVRQFIDWYCNRLEERLPADALRKVS
ncbi:MAG TPA: aromatic ring-hydroxylating dioxygenase subunit alpha [Steroidobacteraceae bacterium]|nr:aromatic ring-hydroxylating dioxygenase subunit alpha [Steroidobacteraceae bacterium]